MNARKALSLLRLDRDADRKADEQGRVVELFRNRAELKKSYQGLRDEIHRLKDRLKQQEGATARVQEMLESLEERLATIETGYPALVFYQLRGLWELGRGLLREFVADLSRQQEEKEQRQHLADGNRRLFVRRKALEQTLHEAGAGVDSARARVGEVENELAGLTRFWHYFRRREAAARLTVLHGAVAAADVAYQEAHAAIEALAGERVAEFPGLSIDARRTINLAAIAYAEVLCLRLSRTRLVALAREAVARREVADEYGERAECESLMGDIARARGVLQQRNNVSREVRARVERLRTLARYRHAADTVPTSDSVGIAEGDALGGEATGASALRLPNVLAEDVWDIYRVLLR